PPRRRADRRPPLARTPPVVPARRAIDRPPSTPPGPRPRGARPPDRGERPPRKRAGRGATRRTPERTRPLRRCPPHTRPLCRRVAEDGAGSEEGAGRAAGRYRVLPGRIRRGRRAREGGEGRLLRHVRGPPRERGVSAACGRHTGG